MSIKMKEVFTSLVTDPTLRPQKVKNSFFQELVVAAKIRNRDSCWICLNLTIT